MSPPSALTDAVTPRPPAAAMRTDTRDLVARFESCALPPWAFGHREHLFVAWTYLREASFEEAAPRFVRSLKRFAAHHGATSKFHATVTWTLLQIVAEAIDAHPACDFEALLVARPDLLDARGLLTKLFDRDVLDSERARRVPLVTSSSSRDRSAP